MKTGTRIKRLEAFVEKYKKLGMRIEIAKSRTEWSDETKSLVALKP
ncbi:hypothetical protein [Metabacillus sp. FJAT-52054]|uniref:Uncharacterized protein n=1 Tax=Metabacillus sediminis TaxID=3117746 RepID=A0ABZ2NIC9_9BACI